MKIKITKEYRTPTNRYVPSDKVLDIDNVYWGKWMIDSGYAVEVADGECGRKPRDDTAYFTISNTGNIAMKVWLSDCIDTERLNMGNAFRGREEAESYRDYLQARAEILSDAKLDRKGLWYITPLLNIAIVGEDTKSVAGFYFNTEEDAKASLDDHSEAWGILADYNHQPWRE